MDDLHDALAKLERAVSAPEPEPVKKSAPALSSQSQTVERDEDSRVVRVFVTRSDGRLFVKTVHRDEDARVTGVDTREESPFPPEMAAPVTDEHYGPVTDEKLAAFRRDFEFVDHGDGHTSYRRRDP